MDDHQFKEKVLPLSKGLFSLCLRIIGDKDEAKDALQDIFVKLWISRESLVDVKNLDAYTKTIARNYCFDKVKLRKIKVSIDTIHISDDSDDHKSTIQEQNDKLNLINIAIKELNPIQQKVFVMRDIDRLSFNEISELIGLTEENIRVMLSRSRKKIRDIIRDSIYKQKVYEH